MGETVEQNTSTTDTDGTESTGTAGVTGNTSGATSAAGDEFKPITSQRDLDALIKDRVARERAKFKDYPELQTKAAEFDKLAEAQKTEAQRQAEAQQAVLARAETAERDLALLREARELDDYKAEISERTGVPAKVLRGSTRDELDEHAASLKALLPEPRKAGVVPTEGRTITTGTGDPAQQFADIIRNARR